MGHDVTLSSISDPTLHTASPVDRQAYRDAMARLGAAVHIITTEGAAGRAGFTASAVCSVTDDPPTLLVCLNRNASVYAAFNMNSVLCVNTLAAGHQPLSNLFSGKTPTDQRFAAAQWSVLATGSPVLQGATASFDCRIVSRTQVGTHDILVCQAVALQRQGEVPALIYFDRRYHTLSPATYPGSLS
jgi:flavin reductase